MSTSNTACTYIINTNNTVLAASCDDVVQSSYDGALITNHSFSNDDNNLEQQALSVEETLHLKPLCTTNKQLSSLDINQSHIDGEIIKNTLTSSMEVEVAPFVRTTDVSNNKKSHQVVLKFLEEDSFGLDSMARIIDEGGIEHTTTDQHSFEILSKDNESFTSILKFPDGITNLKEHNSITSNQIETSYITSENIASCNTVWTCAYCPLTFDNQETAKLHQENNCKEILKSNETTDNFLATITTEKVEGDVLHISSWQDTATSHKSLNSEPYGWNVFWKCVICNKEFNQSQELFHHFMQHSTEDLAIALMKKIMPQYRSHDDNMQQIDNILNNPSDQKSSKQPKLTKPQNQKRNTKTIKIEAEEKIIKNTTTKLENSIDTSVKNLEPCNSTNTKPSQQKDLLNEQSLAHLKPPRNKKTKNSPGSRDPHTCHICQRVLCSRGNLTKHMVLHENNKPWVCSVCGSGFNTKRDYEYHYTYKHRPLSERPYPCDLCNKKFISKRDLKAHKTFHNPCTISCDLCGKMFKTLRCVRRHKKRHTTSKQFQCQFCFKTFGVKDDLASHIKKIHVKPKKKNSRLKNKKILILEPSLDKQNRGSNNQKVVLSSSQLYTKNRDLSEFLLPMNDGSEVISHQLIPSYLDSNHLTTQLPSKEQLIVNKNVLTIIPISEENEEKSCSYEVALNNDAHTFVSQSIDDSSTYVMLSDNDRELDVASSNLNFMYSTASIEQACHTEKSRADLDDSTNTGDTIHSQSSRTHVQETNQNKCTGSEFHEDHRTIQPIVNNTSLTGNVLTLTEESESGLSTPPSNFKHEKNLEESTVSETLPLELLSQNIQL